MPGMSDARMNRQRVFGSLTFAAAVLAAAGATGHLKSATAQNLDTPSAVTAGDPERGRRVFNRCRACHRLGNSNRPLVGPDLMGLFGRTAGTSGNFTGRYSKALAESGIVWNEDILDQWLANPRTFLPGNKMSFAGIRRAEDRADLIAYLKEATATGEDN